MTGPFGDATAHNTLILSGSGGCAVSMGRFAVACALGGVFAGGAFSAATAGRAPSGIEIHAEDVDRFFRIYDAAGGHPSAEQLQHDYLDVGSQGLKHLAKARNVTAEQIARSVEAHPKLYVEARTCMAALPRARARLDVAFARLVELYPRAQKPPVTFAIGRGRPVAISGPGDGVQIGVEAFCGPVGQKFLGADVEDRFVHVVAHEYIHAQQNAVLANDEHPTVLERSLLEGAAEFMGEMISGKVAYAAMRGSTAGHERQIETKFAADVDKTDLDDWIDNTTPEKLGDLGYWVGYRIVKSYYQHAADKRRAIRAIVEMSDPKAFLAKSEWYPGIPLQ